jgi:hypothetical protein
VVDLGRVLLLLLLATAGCEAGPTSDWPRPSTPDEGTDTDRDDDSMQNLDGGSNGSAMDAAARDAGAPPTPDCASDGGDAGCLERDL